VTSVTVDRSGAVLVSTMSTIPTILLAVRACLDDAHHAGVELQITYLKLAHTYLDRADLVWDSYTVRCAYDRARARYASVVHSLGKLQATAEQQARIRQQLTALAARLLNSPPPIVPVPEPKARLEELCSFLSTVTAAGVIGLISLPTAHVTVRRA
jgi:hypothetical protein